MSLDDHPALVEGLEMAVPLHMDELRRIPRYMLGDRVCRWVCPCDCGHPAPAPKPYRPDRGCTRPARPVRPGGRMTDIDIDTVAPWPDVAEDATAEALARHYTAHVQYLHGATQSALRSDPATWRRDIAVLVGSYAAAALLRAVIEHAPERADDVARTLHEDLMEGSALVEKTWEWSHGYGMDPEEIAEAGKAAAKNTT